MEKSQLMKIQDIMKTGEMTQWLRRTCISSREVVWYVAPCGGSKPSVPPVARDLTSSSGLCRQ